MTREDKIQELATKFGISPDALIEMADWQKAEDRRRYVDDMIAAAKNCTIMEWMAAQMHAAHEEFKARRAMVERAGAK